MDVQPGAQGHQALPGGTGVGGQGLGLDPLLQVLHLLADVRMLLVVAVEVHGSPRAGRRAGPPLWNPSPVKGVTILTKLV